MPNAPLGRCPTCGARSKGRCDSCSRRADALRGSTAKRGYSGGHLRRFRPAVLARDPLCVLCGVPATVADHFPTSRRDLVRAGLDPNDPQFGRGLCSSCHGKETVKHQPGGIYER